MLHDQYRQVFDSQNNSSWSSLDLTPYIARLINLCQIEYVVDPSAFFTDIDWTSPYIHQRRRELQDAPFAEPHLRCLLFDLEPDLLQKIHTIRIRNFPYPAFWVKTGILSHVRSLDLHTNSTGWIINSFVAEMVGPSNSLETLKLNFDDGANISVARELSEVLGHDGWPRLTTLHLTHLKYDRDLVKHLGRFKSLRELCLGWICCDKGSWRDELAQLRSLSLRKFMPTGNLREYGRDDPNRFWCIEIEIDDENRDEEFDQRVQDLVCGDGPVEGSLNWLYKNIKCW